MGPDYTLEALAAEVREAARQHTEAELHATKIRAILIEAEDRTEVARLRERSARQNLFDHLK